MTEHEKESHERHGDERKSNAITFTVKKSTLTYVLLFLIIGVMAFNQLMIFSLDSALTGKTTSRSVSSFAGGGDLSQVNVEEIQSTAQGIAALFPVDEMKTTDDVIAMMVPTGTPEYGEAMGVSFDKPVESLELMANSFNTLSKQIKESDPEVWQRYLNLAAAPRGISCEYCCGVGAQGATEDGRSKCGCQHNPALLTLTLWLMKNTDYSDAEILREVYRWKTLFFPKNMVELASQIAGGDASVLEELPGMVGGC
jgi:hypothetical protein